MSKQEIIQISLRLNPDVYEILKAKTRETGRSLNAEIIQAVIEHCDPNSMMSKIDSLERFAYEMSARFPDAPQYGDILSAASGSSSPVSSSPTKPSAADN